MKASHPYYMPYVAPEELSGLPVLQIRLLEIGPRGKGERQIPRAFLSLHRVKSIGQWFHHCKSLNLFSDAPAKFSMTRSIRISLRFLTVSTFILAGLCLLHDFR
jgi:hypothetical protein